MTKPNAIQRYISPFQYEEDGFEIGGSCHRVHLLALLCKSKMRVDPIPSAGNRTLASAPNSKSYKDNKKQKLVKCPVCLAASWSPRSGLRIRN